MQVNISLQEIVGSANLSELVQLSDMIKNAIIRAKLLTDNEKYVAKKNKIKAIKLLRERTGLELRQCRDMIYDELGLDNGDKI